ncbi:MAG: hypothetical protein GF344_20245 [Chitinivibrionales bacterium]|nr:hypothetical protein [Chitinivibrionales bacterium]
MTCRVQSKSIGKVYVTGSPAYRAGKNHLRRQATAINDGEKDMRNSQGCNQAILVLAAIVLGYTGLSAAPEVTLQSPQAGMGILDNLVHIHATMDVYRNGTSNDLNAAQTYNPDSDLTSGATQYCFKLGARKFRL